MEVLKKLLCVIICLLAMVQARAQSEAALQRAYKSSYAEEAKKNYTEAINDIKPFYSDGDYESNLRLGWLYFLSKNYTASENYYAKAVRIKPNSIEAKFGYIKPLSLLASWDKVLAQYASILKIDPQNTQANYWAGIIFYNRKQYDAASKYFLKVVSLYPFDYDGNQMLGWAYLMAGNKASARTYFEQALIIKPDDTSCLDGLTKARN
ncbi:tetratricopeptide repeat protein [Mucilaginibacter psychrotolerans]|uniref:Tetratricopeptide repeat protein n=1 Tax=Mucilaginibacter psychrotolerans TaxID=1524096 RepID=A0A4Y8S6B5_9SPHI|nr:tetratricopeptide repeat protein [Mucilaginibacter psychrotolerans]TFF34498.1 tetratricopeptide repeat protein [Mucilaginibacter psychrotolerans]